LPKDVEWQAQIEELAEHVAKLLIAGFLDTEWIVEVKTRIASHPSIHLTAKTKIVNTTALSPALSPPTGDRHIRDPSTSRPPDNNEKGYRETPPH
jgi:hypothetical protein